MFDFISKSIAKIFGTKSERDLKGLQNIVSETSEEFEKLQNISDEQLRAKTAEFKDIIAEKLRDIDLQLDDIKDKIANNPDMSVDDKETLFNETDKLEVQRNKELEVVLKEIMPAAFAVIKETARRFAQNGSLKVKATLRDKFLAASKKNIEIVDEEAIWHNKWLAAGNEITWDMVHYDVQLIGGAVLHEGKISEMATGEGKTLVSTLPSYLNALGGRGVHLVTVNDYLAKRDSEWNAPLFEFHGLVVDCIDKHEPNTEARRKAYQADITYGTNNEFGFDYLRDNMASSPEEQVQRRLHYAIVDEVDSVLIDDARTPLIISGPVPKGDEQEFIELKPSVSKIVEAQRKLCQDYLIEAKKLIDKGDTDNGGMALFRAYRGMPKAKPLIKYLSETGIRTILNKTESIHLAENQKLMPKADEPLYFTIDEKSNQVELTDKGIDYITVEGNDSNFYILPDLSTSLNQIEKNSELNNQEKLAQKEAVITDYSVKSQRIHTVNQLLKAYTLFEKDTEYVIMDHDKDGRPVPPKVMIVDEQTGRIMEGRRYSDGLHQAIEAKENVKVEDATQTYATVTLQNYFRMYHKLCGMTGTAITEAGEFWQIYKLDVVEIPTNKSIVRKDQEDKVYKTIREKYNATAQEIQELVAAGRPVLVGTTSVENSELLSRMLKMKNIPHNVLNAKYHQREAEIVAEAGKPGTVTIATNMAGRGTDIKLTPESRSAGGLAIVGTERHESRRVDRQLRGRAGRQGDVGSSQFFVSLEDNLMRLFGSERIAGLMDKLGMEEGEVIQHGMISKSIERAQKKVEENHFGTRKRLLEYDDVMNYQRDAIYKRRTNALYGDRLALDIANNVYDVCEEIAASNTGNFENLELRCIEVLGIEPPFTSAEYKSLNDSQVTSKLYNAATQHYNQKNHNIAATALPIFKQINAERGSNTQSVVVPITDGIHSAYVSVSLQKALGNNCKELVTEIEKFITLSIIDQEWKEHLREMDDLKQSVQNASYEQKDPLLIYKFESVELFKRFLYKVNADTVSFLMKAQIANQEAAPQQAPSRPQTAQPKLKASKEDLSGLIGDVQQHLEVGNDYHDPSQRSTEKIAPRQAIKIADRNQRVTVQYQDGTVKKDVKYKTVEQDVERGLAVVIA
jgi:preprotein translocase subunit SecA